MPSEVSVKLKDGGSSTEKGYFTNVNMELSISRSSNRIWVALEIIDDGDLIQFLGDSASYMNTALGLFHGFEMLQEPSQHETRIGRVSRIPVPGDDELWLPLLSCLAWSLSVEPVVGQYGKECWFGQVLGLTWCQEALDL